MPDLIPCDICELLPGMTMKDGDPLCPRCAREKMVFNALSEELAHQLTTHVLPTMKDVVQTWAAFWIASGLITDKDAPGIAEGGLARVFADSFELARQALQADGKERETV